MFRQHIREIDDNARLLCTDQLVMCPLPLDSNVSISAHFSYHTAVWNQNRRRKASRCAFPNGSNYCAWSASSTTPCYSPSLLHGTRSRKPDVGPEVFRMLPVRRYRYYLTRSWLNWLRSVTFDCIE